MNYVILAAGKGSRFKKDGIATPKPLVEISGKPMIGRLIKILADSGADRINVVANSSMPSLITYLEELKAKGYPVNVMPYASRSSFDSLHHAAEGLEGKFIAMTVDTVFRPDEFRSFVEAVEKMPSGHVTMALTRFVDDECPLYAHIGDNGEISDYRYGGGPFPGAPIVSAGIYGLTAEAVRAAEANPPASLNEFQKTLASDTDIRVMPFEFSKVIDVDNAHDREAAEKFVGPVPFFHIPALDRIRAEYLASLKSRDTEENIDLLFYRPIGFAWAYLFRSMHVSPNVVTIASIFIGIAAGICFYPQKLWINCLGMFLLIWANTYDSADGQLARLTGQHSRLGRVLDGIAGDLWFISIYIAICLRTNEHVGYFAEHKWLIWVIAFMAGFFHARQAAIADHYRQIHLYFLKGTAGSELDSSDDLRRRYEHLPWNRHFFLKIVLFVYYKYTVAQEKLTPEMKRLSRLLKQNYGKKPVPAQLAERFRALSLPLCKWENFMTFNWRTVFLFTSLFIGMPWLYFVAELTVFNIVLVYTVRRHESICRQINAELADSNIVF